MLTVLATAETDVVAGFVKDAGAIAAAVTAIGIVVWWVVRTAVNQMVEMVTERTEPLHRNGGSSVGDLPKRVDALEERMDQMRETQIEIREAQALVAERIELIKAVVTELHHPRRL